MRSKEELAERVRRALQQDPFLVELGQRARCSQNKAGRAAQMLGLADEEVKIVADVVRLKDRDPDAFQQVLQDTRKGVEMEKTTECEYWVDERGKKVVIAPFLSQVFKDDEVHDLWTTARFTFSDFFLTGICLGKREYECFVEDFMRLCYLHNQLVGFAKKELTDWYDEWMTRGGFWIIDNLISLGYLRKKWVTGIEVVFPTELLVQKIQEAIEANRAFLNELNNKIFVR